MKWKKRWNQWLSENPVRPGIWRRRDGGFLVEGRIKAPGGKVRGTQAIVDVASVADAQRERDRLLDELWARVQGKQQRQQRFSEFAAALFERKKTDGSLNSPATIDRWVLTLTKHLLPQFGGYWCHELDKAHIEEWKAAQAKRYAEPKRIQVPHPKKPEALVWRRNPAHVGPRTVNGWLSILGVITKEMTAVLKLARDPMTTVSPLGTKGARTYTKEKPNALGPANAAGFLPTWKRLFPQHYHFVLLGSATGLRPSSLRPLRRKGPNADMLWKEGRVFVRRSHSRRQVIVDFTKTDQDQDIHVAPSVMAELEEYAKELDASEVQKVRESELLFPTKAGKLRARSALAKPFRAVAKAMGLPYDLTPKAMRRTFNDLARASGVGDVVTRSISGHATEAMQEHYSTARAEEQREATRKITEKMRGSLEQSDVGPSAGPSSGLEENREES